MQITITDKTKIMIIIGIFAVVIFLFYQNHTDDESDNNEMMIKNDGTLMQSQSQSVADVSKKVRFNDDQSQGSSQSQQSSNQSSNYSNSVISDNKAAESAKALAKKFKTRNQSKNQNDFASSSYATGKRSGNKTDDLDRFFEGTNPLDGPQGGSNFMANHDTEQYATYVSGKPKKIKDVDKFDTDALLPKEENNDWMDNPYQSTTIKNSHLINIYKPVAANTIQGSLKIPTHDIRGVPPNPKMAISPFNNSSVEPDTNIRNQELCF